MRRREVLYRWPSQHPDLVDAALAAGLTALCLLFGVDAGGWGGAVLVLAQTAPLALRRRHPVLATSVVAAAAVLQLVVLVPPHPGNLGVLVALHAVTAHGPRWAGRAALALAIAGALVAGVLFAGAGYEVVLFWVVAGSLVLAAWAVGDVVRLRQKDLRTLHERTRHLELERDAASRLAAADERARIAREMHDVVAHSLSVVIAQSDGGRYAAAHDPAAAVTALTTIGETGRGALADMRRLLGVLSTDDDEASRPQPGQDDLPELVRSVRDAGLPVELMVQGHPRALPRAEGLALYRVVQESLTNVLKHAGPARVDVVLRWRARHLEVSVRDDGYGAAAPSALDAPADRRDDERGRGLVGMRERAALFGGTLRAAPRPGGGFAVDLLLPYPEERR